MPQAFARLHPVSATFSSYWSPLIYSPSVTCWDHLKSVHPAPPCPSLFLLLLPTVPHSPGLTSWFLCLSPWNVRTLKLEIFTLCPLLHPEGAQ